MCGLWGFDRVKPAEELVEPRRNNPTIQDQACNSRGKEMSASLLGREREQKKPRGEAEMVQGWSLVENVRIGSRIPLDKRNWAAQFAVKADVVHFLTTKTLQKGDFNIFFN